jgi:two-component system response regulator AtoC/two-component system nitrogen regulation response regulator NtrX
MSNPTEARSATVLVVDDQPFFTTMLHNVLEQQGFRVLVANSGSDGLKTAKEQSPDVILLDIEMPGMDGFVVCEQLRKAEPVKHIPIIILTGTNNPKLNERAFKAGADIVALKVLSSERLVNMIRLALGKGKAPSSA